MSADSQPLIEALNARFLLDHPREAARELEAMPASQAAELLGRQPILAVVRTWQALASDVASAVLVELPRDVACHVLSEADPLEGVAALCHLEVTERRQWLADIDPRVAGELRQLMDYPESSAGRIMDMRVAPLRVAASIGDALERLRAVQRSGLRELFAVDEDGRLAGRVEVQDLALAEAGQPLRSILKGVIAVVKDVDPLEEVVETLQSHPISALPVITDAGRFVGVIRQAELISAVEQESSVDLQRMVGASVEERALSPAGFAVRKRLPWLQINLLTAFLAAAVVGLFQGLIAKFTALAVLLPVVAGQSGNAGAQALAVTMRGLVLREISLRQWPRVLGKEALAGLLNGLSVAATTGIGVYVWSHSLGLVMIIVAAMIIAMIVAGLAGALVPILLRRFGQDPATASSIILTTITDVTGFFSFLGIATLLASTLQVAPG